MRPSIEKFLVELFGIFVAIQNCLSRRMSELKPLEILGFSLDPWVKYLADAEKNRGAMINQWSSAHFRHEIRVATTRLKELTEFNPHKLLTSEWLRVELNRRIELVSDEILMRHLNAKHRELRLIMRDLSTGELMAQMVAFAHEIEAVGEMVANKPTDLSIVRQPRNDKRAKSAKRATRIKADEDRRERMRGGSRKKKAS